MAQGPQSRGIVIAVGVVFTTFAWVFVGLRLWARRIKGLRLFIDDYLILTSATLLVICLMIPMIVSAALAGLGDHMAMGPEGMPVPPSYTFNVILRIYQTVHTIPIMFAKLSILFFYRRVFRGPSFSAISWATIILVIVWGIGFFFSILFECVPIDLSLKAPPGTPGVYCINQTANFWALSISDVVVDLIILIIPIPFVWKLKMPVRHKIAVSVMFLLGAMAIAASVARLVVFIDAGKRLAQNDLDLTHYVAPTKYWVLIECSLAIVSACLPMLRPVFHGWSLETMFRSFASKLMLTSTPSGVSSGGASYRNTDPKSSTADLKAQRPGFSAVVTTTTTPESTVMQQETYEAKAAGVIMVQKGWTREEETAV